MVDAGSYDSALATARAERDDWITVETTRTGTAEIATGTAGTAPIHLTTRAGTLYGSWDLLSVHEQAADTGLDLLEITRRVSLRTRYTPATFWRGIHLLTERATAHLARDGALTLRLPEPAEHTRARTLRADADPVPAFIRLLGHLVARHPWEGPSTGVQLSGGLDSTNIALALAAALPGHHVTAGAVVLDGERGRQQTERRAVILRHIGASWRDVLVPAMDHLPYGPTSWYSRPGRVSPYGDLYLDAIDRLSDLLSSRGVKTLFTGIGGDELMSFTTAEKPRGVTGPDLGVPPWLGPTARGLLAEVDRGITPAAVVPETALMAKAGVAAPLLRRGIWPVHPLTDPALIRFSEWMPAEWRRDKCLLRETIDRAGLPPHIARPPIPENFGHVMTLAMRRHGPARIHRLLDQGSPLIEAGITDPVELKAVADRLCRRDDSRADREVVFALLADSALTGR
ncbi:asparagine synthase-related protein [Kitasatospora sp. NPDC058115]|uniref:asparagine synthase-related protein n=1 Tax=Kitasatospora sp. NPDC058115 TaxID=3346347 RepID=UPI0036D994BD